MGKDNPWLDQHIRQNHGPLGAMHPPTEYLMEGDTPSFLWLIPNGLNEPEHPNWGGWGGRYELYTPPPKRYYYEPETRPIWTNAMDEVRGIDGEWYTSNHATIWRWRTGYQHDFAARIDWSNTGRREDANHPPQVVIEGDKTRRPALITAAPGSTVVLDASESSDPDDNSISFRWYPYREVGTFPVAIDLRNFEIRDDDTDLANFTAPHVDSPKSLHIILEVQDDAEPTLTSYRRVIVTIDPAAGE